MRHFRIATETRTRLACVKHAASVRSEPGSNSRLKPVAWRKKMPSDEPSESQPTKQIIVARFTQTACARKGQTVRTDSGTSYRLSKSDKPPCPAERRCEQLKEYTGGPRGCQPGNLGFPQSSSGDQRTPAAARENHWECVGAMRVSDSLTGRTPRLSFGSATATMCGHGAKPSQPRPERN